MGNVRFKHGLPAARSGAMAAFGQRRRISQQAFDACVAENVEDCGMGREEAVWNAYEHFDFQNADLSAVDPDGPGERREARDVLRIQVALLARGVGGATRAELDAALAFAAARAAVDGLALLAASEDAAAEIVRAGGARACRDALRERRGSAARRRGLAGVLRHLAGDDGAKDAMCADGTLEELLEVLETFRDEDPALGEHVVACLARMALRRPANAAKIGVAGGALVVAAMAAHPAHAGLNRQGALALRNLVARNPEHAAPLLAAGAEARCGRRRGRGERRRRLRGAPRPRRRGRDGARGDADPPRLL
ncbi:hypothetical protein JL721_10533 [Aureococcus anophagefferens]|nr:hypothetical protein JL721_10533 [Aureococcus anophagefferens]